MAWKIALVAGFVGLGLFGLGLIAAAFWYPTGVFWGIIVVSMGVIGVLIPLSAALSTVNRPKQLA